MKKLIVFIFLIFSFTSIAQGKLETGVHYPLYFGDSYVNRNNTGIVGVDFRYRFVKIGVVSLKAGISADYLVDDFDDNIIFDNNTYVFQPRVIAEVNLAGISKLKPYAGFGYSVIYVDGIVNGGAIFFSE